jgi:hypothetical protein
MRSGSGPTMSAPKAAIGVLRYYKGFWETKDLYTGKPLRLTSAEVECKNSPPTEGDYLIFDAWSA